MFDSTPDKSSNIPNTNKMVPVIVFLGCWVSEIAFHLHTIQLTMQVSLASSTPFNFTLVFTATVQGKVAHRSFLLTFSPGVPVRQQRSRLHLKFQHQLDVLRRHGSNRQVSRAPSR